MVELVKAVTDICGQYTRPLFLPQFKRKSHLATQDHVNLNCHKHKNFSYTYGDNFVTTHH